MSSPVTVRPINMHWISDVPSKIVKFFARAESAVSTETRLICGNVDSQGFR